eukprot:8017_1
MSLRYGSQKVSPILKTCTYLGYYSSSRSLYGAINFARPKLLEGYLYEDLGKRYYVLKGNHLYAFIRHHSRTTVQASEVFDLDIYDKVEQIAYNTNKFMLSSTTTGDEKLFTTETTKEMLSWVRNIQCIQQNIKQPTISFIDQTNKRTPYINH